MARTCEGGFAIDGNERIDKGVTMETPMEIFKSEDGKVQVNVIIENETAWLTQSAMAELFGVQKSAITLNGRELLKMRDVSAMRSPRKLPRCASRSSRADCARRSVARVSRNLSAICGIWKMTTTTNREVNDGNQDYEE